MELQTTRKRSRTTAGGGGGGGDGLAVDRLSALPDCLLRLVMTFMKARQVVQTCVLSKRWEHLWRTVPCLDVDYGEFLRKDGQDEIFYDEAWQTFEDFADNLFFRHNIAHVDTFRLQVNSDRFSSCLLRFAARWIRCSIKYRAKVDGNLREGLSSNSWQLKRLYLSNVYLDDCFAKHVRFGCPSLEDMELRKCEFELDEIASHSLKNLLIHGCYCERKTRFTVTTTAVTSLCLSFHSNSFPGGICLNMPSIASASIHIKPKLQWILLPARAVPVSWLSVPCYMVRVVEFSDDGNSMPSALMDLASSVGVIFWCCLNIIYFQVIPSEPANFPEFKNLKTLSLDDCNLSDDFQLLIHFLQNSPNLEKLTLRCCQLPKDSIDYKKRKGKAKSKKTSLVDIRCENLKLTEIIYRSEDVLQLIEFLLGNSGNLPKNMKLTKVD